MTSIAHRTTVQTGVVPTHLKFVGGLVPDDQGRLPRDQTGAVLVTAEMARLIAAAPVQIGCVQIPYFPGLDESDVAEMVDVIFEEFKGTGNMEIVLDRALVDKRIWPAIDIMASGTRREEKLFDEDEYERICQVRRLLSEISPTDAMDKLTTRLKKTKSNAEFLLSLKPGGSL